MSEEGVMLRALRFVVIAAAVTAVSPSPAHAQGTTHVLQLAPQGATIRVSSPVQQVGKGDVLEVQCTGFDCRRVRVRAGATELTSQSTEIRAVFEIPPVEGVVQVRVCPAGATACDDAPAVVEIAIGSTPAAGGAPSRPELLRMCATVGVAQVNEIVARRGRMDVTVIIFDETGPCFLSRQFASEGDPIAVGFISTAGYEVHLDLDPCGTLGAAPKVLISADTSTITFQSGRVPEGLSVQWFPPLRRCFGAAVGVKLAVKPGAAQAKELAYTLKQFERYRATLQIGAAASDLHQQTFGLRADGTDKRIIETSAGERGPEYVGALVLYGLPHYFIRRVSAEPCYVTAPGKRDCAKPELPAQREPYYGRDPVNESGFADRIGLLAGAGASQPGRRFVLGGAFDVIPGVNVFVVREFVRRGELEGVAVGDVFAGEAATIPTRDHWRQAWVAGVSLDTRYALAFLARK
jgi:hypothetical protein